MWKVKHDQYKNEQIIKGQITLRFADCIKIFEFIWNGLWSHWRVLNRKKSVWLTSYKLAYLISAALYMKWGEPWMEFRRLIKRRWRLIQDCGNDGEKKSGHMWNIGQALLMDYIWDWGNGPGISLLTILGSSFFNKNISEAFYLFMIIFCF